MYEIPSIGSQKRLDYNSIISKNSVFLHLVDEVLIRSSYTQPGHCYSGEVDAMFNKLILLWLLRTTYLYLGHTCY